MAEIHAEGFKIFSVEGKVFRKMALERIEVLLVQDELSKAGLANKVTSSYTDI
ncbi:hypothetical protein ACP3V5_02555 [Vibrio maritimus]|jgi:hypothetical protein